jgi:hypothetical protein
MDEGAGFAKLLLDGLVPDTFSFDVNRQAFGYKAHFTMKPFGKHAAVAFDLVDPVIDFIKPAVYPLESTVDLLEAAVNLLEPLIQPMNKPMKALIEVLN